MESGKRILRIHNIIMIDSRYLCIIMDTIILDTLLTSDLIVKAGEGVMVRTVSAPLHLCSRHDKTILASTPHSDQLKMDA